MIDTRRRGRASADQAGFTLVELLVAMAIFSIFLVIIVSSVTAITRVSTRAQVTARSASGVLAVFQSFDRQFRYADAVNFPGPGATTGSRYIEFRVPALNATTTAPTCVQWRYWPATQSIQSQQWPENGAPLYSWVTRVSNVTDPGGAGYPFTLTPAAANGTPPTQQLLLTISTGLVSAPGASISSSFIARNSSTLSPGNANTRVRGVSDTPVCSARLIRQ